MTKMNRVVENDPPPVPYGTTPQDWVHEWKLVRADSNMRNDVLVGGQRTTLELQFDAKTSAFTVVGDAPPAFAGCTLGLKGTQAPDLLAASLGALPAYSAQHEARYCDALDHHLIPYLKADMAKGNGGDLVRLEGVIRIQCCWPRKGTMHAQMNPEPHFVDTDVRLYQFKEGVSDGDDPKTSTLSTLLVVWAPDSPRLPANPDGTVMGIA
jgi:hypothetical protein